MPIFRQNILTARPLRALVAQFLVLILLLTGCASAQVPATAQPTAEGQLLLATHWISMLARG